MGEETCGQLDTVGHPIAERYCDKPKGHKVIKGLQNTHHRHTESGLWWYAEHEERAEVAVAGPQGCRPGYERADDATEERLMGEMKYPTVVVTRFLDDGQIVVAVTDAGDDGDDSTVGTGFGIALGESFRLVPVPQGERMVVVVTEGGEWPKDAQASILLFARGGFAQTAAQVLDALAEGSE
jgi:hypothetical protein